MFYKDLLSKESQSKLTTDDIRILVKEEQLITKLTMFIIVLGFFALVASLAMIIWSTKLTLFLAGVAFMPYFFCRWARRVITHNYKRGLRELENELNSQKKQAV